MIRPLIAIDVGSGWAVVLVVGTFDCPVLVDAVRGSRWDGEKIVGAVKRWRRSKRGRRAAIWCEDTFTGPKWLRDVGRSQEAQIGFLQGMLGDVFERVPPVDGTEADIAWNAFGRPEQGRGNAGAHVRDALGIAWKALNRMGELPPGTLEEIRVERWLEGQGRSKVMR